MAQASYTSGILFTQAHRAVRVRIYNKLALYDLTPIYWTLLGMVADKPDGVRASVLAQHMQVKPPMVTVMVNELVKRSLVTQHPHPIDGRAKIIAITETGKKLARTIEKELSQEIDNLLHGLSNKELDVFQKTLETILRNAQEVS